MQQTARKSGENDSGTRRCSNQTLTIKARSKGEFKSWSCQTPTDGHLSEPVANYSSTVSHIGLNIRLADAVVSLDRYARHQLSAHVQFWPYSQQATQQAPLFQLVPLFFRAAHYVKTAFTLFADKIWSFNRTENLKLRGKWNSDGRETFLANLRTTPPRNWGNRSLTCFPKRMTCTRSP